MGTSEEAIKKLTAKSNTSEAKQQENKVHVESKTASKQTESKKLSSDKDISTTYKLGKDQNVEKSVKNGDSLKKKHDENKAVSKESETPTNTPKQEKSEAEDISFSDDQIKEKKVIGVSEDAGVSGGPAALGRN